MSFADLEPLRKEAENGKLDVIFTIRDSVRYANFETVKLEEMSRVLFYTEQLFENSKKQLTEKKNVRVNQPEGEHLAEVKYKKNRSVQDFRDTIFFTVADGTYDSRELVQEYLKFYGFAPKVQLVPKIEEAVARTYGGMGAMIIDEWSREMKNTFLQHIILDSCNEAVLAWRNENKNKVVDYFLQEIRNLLCTR